MAKPRTDPSGRFWPKVDKTDGCWSWLGGRTNGYGHFNAGGAGGPYVAAHRFAYVELRGPVPPGMVLDHLCRNRLCVNPDHLEVTTHAVNIKRGVAPRILLHNDGRCARGHDAQDSYRRRTGQKAGQVAYCRACRRADRDAGVPERDGVDSAGVEVG